AAVAGPRSRGRRDGRRGGVPSAAARGAAHGARPVAGGCAGRSARAIRTHRAGDAAAPRVRRAARAAPRRARTRRHAPARPRVQHSLAAPQPGVCRGGDRDSCVGHRRQQRRGGVDPRGAAPDAALHGALAAGDGVGAPAGVGGSGDRLGASLPEFVDYRDRNRVFSAMAGFENDELDLTGDGPPERLAAAEVTSNLFATLGVRPVLGRDFTAADGQEGAGKVAILSYPLWQSRFGGDASVVGRVVRLNEQSYTVVGVMPRGFEFPWPGMPLSDKADLWTPLVFTRAALAARAESYDVRMVARLAPGVTLDHARADLTRIVDGFREEYPQIYAGNVQTQTMVDGLVADARADARPLLLAGAGHVVGQALIEALVLAAVGAGVGIGLAAALVGIIRRFGPDNIAGLAQARIDGH